MAATQLLERTVSKVSWGFRSFKQNVLDFILPDRGQVVQLDNCLMTVYRDRIVFDNHTNRQHAIATLLSLCVDANLLDADMHGLTLQYFCKHSTIHFVLRENVKAVAQALSERNAAYTKLRQAHFANRKKYNAKFVLPFSAPTSEQDAWDFWEQMDLAPSARFNASVR